MNRITQQFQEASWDFALIFPSNYVYELRRNFEFLFLSLSFPFSSPSLGLAW